MKLSIVFGFLMALVISTQAMAFAEYSYPPFASFTCQSTNTSIKVEIAHYRGTVGAGPAVIYLNGVDWGGWNWKAADGDYSGLTSYYYLEVMKGGSNPIHLQTSYSPHGELINGWLETSGYSGQVDCKINGSDPKPAPQCKVERQNDCSISPKRLCCYCVNGEMSCN